MCIGIVIQVNGSGSLLKYAFVYDWRLSYRKKTGHVSKRLQNIKNIIAVVEMADNGGYAGVMLDLIFMDEDILDGEFDEEITRDIKEVRKVHFFIIYIEKNLSYNDGLSQPQHTSFMHNNETTNMHILYLPTTTTYAQPI